MKMTKISLALAMLGLSAVAFAGAPGNQVTAPSGINLIAPDSVGVWSIGLEAAYVEPTNNQFTYGQLGNGSGDNGYNRRSDRTVDQDWQWLGSVDLTYLFPGNSRDVKIAWTHLFEDTDSNHTTPGAGQLFHSSFGEDAFGPGNNITLPGATLTETGTAKGSVETDYNAVDLVFGQWIKIGDRLDLHPFGGLRWAEVDSTFKGRYNSNTNVSIDVADSTLTGNAVVNNYDKISSDFDGIGPRAGFDTAVHLGSGFSIVGTFAGSLLIGDIDSSFRHSDVTTTTTSFGGVSTATSTSTGYRVKPNNDNTSVVPELDARIGLDYMYAFNPTTSMNIQLGYQVVNYFNVTEADYQSIVGVSGVPNTISDREDWGYQGPYLRLQLNIA